MGNGAFCTSNKANVVHPQEEVVASAATQQLEGTSRPPLRVVSVTATALATASAAKMTTLETTNKYRYMLIEGEECMVIRIPRPKKTVQTIVESITEGTIESLNWGRFMKLKKDAVTYKLKLILQELDKGEFPPTEELRKTIHLAVDSISSELESTTVKRDEVGLELLADDQVRSWLATTFTRTESTYDGCLGVTPIVRFKAAANTIMIGQYLGSIVRDLPEQITLPGSDALTSYLQNHLDLWEFDIFLAGSLSGNRPLKYVGYELFNKHQLFDKFEIPPAVFLSFISKIEEGYSRHNNPYHNSCHGADVAQTLHCFIHNTGLRALLTDVEVLAMLLAALVHDVDHPGTTNTFHINQQSHYALLYNDHSVLENHHLFFTFKLLQEAEYNFLKNLSLEDYKNVRALVVEMVLATDMSFHFDQLKLMRQLMSAANSSTHLLVKEPGKVFSLLLHLADMSHPGKPWHLHKEWSYRLANEFYLQGDKERKLGLSPSPLCDRATTNLPKSQLGFIKYIVNPLYELSGEMLELLIKPSSSQSSSQNSLRNSPSVNGTHDLAASLRVWQEHLIENEFKWKELANSPAVVNGENGQENGHENGQENGHENGQENGHNKQDSGAKQMSEEEEEREIVPHKQVEEKTQETVTGQCHLPPVEIYHNLTAEN